MYGDHRLLQRIAKERGHQPHHRLRGLRRATRTATRDRTPEERSAYTPHPPRARTTPATRTSCNSSPASHLEGFYQKPAASRPRTARPPGATGRGMVALSGCMSSQLGAVPDLPTPSDRHTGRPSPGRRLVRPGGLQRRRVFPGDTTPRRHVDNIDTLQRSTSSSLPTGTLASPSSPPTTSHYVSNREDAHRSTTSYTCHPHRIPQSTTSNGLHLQGPVLLSSRAELGDARSCLPDLPHALDNAYQHRPSSAHIEMDYERRADLPAFRHSLTDRLRRRPTWQQPLPRTASAELSSSRGDQPPTGNASNTSSRSSAQTQLRRLLPHRLGHHPAFTRERRGSSYGVRGSAAASLVLYCLDITVADPIHYRPRLRAFSQPRTQGDARHRHGLPGRPPRRAHPNYVVRTLRPRTASPRSSPSARIRPQIGHQGRRASPWQRLLPRHGPTKCNKHWSHFQDHLASSTPPKSLGARASKRWPDRSHPAIANHGSSRPRPGRRTIVHHDQLATPPASSSPPSPSRSTITPPSSPVHGDGGEDETST